MAWSPGDRDCGITGAPTFTPQPLGLLGISLFLPGCALTPVTEGPSPSEPTARVQSCCHKNEGGVVRTVMTDVLLLKRQLSATATRSGGWRRVAGHTAGRFGTGVTGACPSCQFQVGFGARLGTIWHTKFDSNPESR